MICFTTLVCFVCFKSFQMVCITGQDGSNDPPIFSDFPIVGIFGHPRVSLERLNVAQLFLDNVKRPCFFILRRMKTIRSLLSTTDPPNLPSHVATTEPSSTAQQPESKPTRKQPSSRGRSRGDSSNLQRGWHMIQKLSYPTNNVRKICGHSQITFARERG